MRRKLHQREQESRSQMRFQEKLLLENMKMRAQILRMLS
jgi:hypothetical protein